MLRDWSDTTPGVTASYDARGLVQTLTIEAANSGRVPATKFF